jgi:hypothetical protein
MIISRRILANGIARADGSALSKGFLDDLVSEIERLPDRLKAAGEALALLPFEPGAGMAGFFQDKTHFGHDRHAAPGSLNCSVFCGCRRDTPDELCCDHARPKLRDKIIDQVEQGAEETNGSICFHNNVELCYFIAAVKWKSFRVRRSTFGVWRSAGAVVLVLLVGQRRQGKAGLSDCKR